MITIIECKNPTELHCHYPNQTESQPCYIEIDLDNETMCADYNAEIGNAVPFNVWHNRTRRYPIPCLTGNAANELMKQLFPLAQKMVDGYETEWNGHNYIGTLNEKAQEAEDKLSEICESLCHESESDQIQEWEADDWLHGQLPEGCVITANTTDGELRQIEDKIYSELDENVVVLGVYNYLESLRKKAQEENE